MVNRRIASAAGKSHGLHGSGAMGWRGWRCYPNASKAHSALIVDDEYVHAQHAAVVFSLRKEPSRSIENKLRGYKVGWMWCFASGGMGKNG